MASPGGTRRARYTGQSKSICMRLAFIATKCFLVSDSIVIGDYYSGDARRLVVNDYTMLVMDIRFCRLLWICASTL